MNQCTKRDVRGDDEVNSRREATVAFSKRGNSAISSNEPQYSGNTIISIPMMRITFMTPPAW